MQFKVNKAACGDEVKIVRLGFDGGKIFCAQNNGVMLAGSQ
jgi:hypothetical protein